MFEVLESARFVVRESGSVHIDEEAVERFAGRLVREHVPTPGWDGAHHLSGTPEEVVGYLLVLDTINFCFWPPLGEEVWRIGPDGRTVSGYIGLALALKRALEAGVPMTDAGFLCDLSPGRLARVLGGRGRLQLMEERARALRELGEALRRNFDGKPHGMVEAAQGWAGDLARLLARMCPSFRDTAVFRERAVYFYKRGQILAADLHGALGGMGWGAFHDLDRVTAFADYKLPQVLRALGVLVYGEPLAARVDRREELLPGSPEEVEIRAGTIVAVEKIREAAARLGRPLRAFEVDGILWHMGQGASYRSRPYHRVRTVFY